MFRIYYFYVIICLLINSIILIARNVRHFNIKYSNYIMLLKYINNSTQNTLINTDFNISTKCFIVYYSISQIYANIFQLNVTFRVIYFRLLIEGQEFFYQELQEWVH